MSVCQNKYMVEVNMVVFGVLAIAVLICQATAQFYNGPTISNIGLPLQQQLQLKQIPKVPSFGPNLRPSFNCLSYSPFIKPTPVISTTLVDNSVANSLANTLQLLIVSELLESSLNQAPCGSNIVPLYDAIGTIGTTVSPLDVLSPNIDVTTVSYGSVVDVSTVVTDVVTSAPIIEVTQAPVTTNYVTEVVSPVTSYSQSIYAPVTEVLAPAPVTSTITNVYGSVYEGQAPLVTEVSSAISSIPSIDVYTSFTDVNTVSVVNTPVNPYYISPTYVTEVTEIVDIPYLQLPYPVSFAPIDAAPVSYISDYYTGYADVVTPVPTSLPFPAEIIIPSSIPAQIRCSFGYSPVNVPYLNMNVEPLSSCSGYVY